MMTKERKKERKKESSETKKTANLKLMTERKKRKKN